MSDYFNETHEQVRQTARKFIDTHVRPYIDDWEEAGEFPGKSTSSQATQGFWALASLRLWAASLRATFL